MTLTIQHDDFWLSQQRTAMAALFPANPDLAMKVMEKQCKAYAEALEDQKARREIAAAKS